MSGLDVYYRKMEDANLKDPKSFYSMRYFQDNEYFHRKFDEMTPEKIKIRKVCPKPRLTAFCNGSVYFPFEKRFEVLKHISYDIKTDTPLYWNQIAYEEDGFRLVIDVDSDERVLSAVEINKMAVVLWETLKSYYPNFEKSPITVIGSVCGPRMKKGKLSTGVHFICHVDVKMEEALQIIYGYRLRLMKNNSINMKGLVVDDGIYKTKARQVSLRFVYANKLEDCICCKNITEKRMACTTCDRKGILVSKMAYQPAVCLGKDGRPSTPAFQDAHKDFLSVVHNHSIWPVESDRRTDYCKPCVDPLYTIEKSFEKGLSKSKKRKTSNGSDIVPGDRKKYKVSKVSNSVYEKVEEFLRDIVWNGESWWEGLCVDNIRVANSNLSAQIFVTGLGSTMCLYAKKDHGTNRLWFSLNTKGVLTLQCNSQKEEYGCKQKSRICFTLPKNICNTLFGVENPPAFETSSSLTTPERNPEAFLHTLDRKRPVDRFQQQGDSYEHAKQLERLNQLYKLNVKTKKS
jgi:hypothetical protein